MSERNYSHLIFFHSSICDRLVSCEAQLISALKLQVIKFSSSLFRIDVKMNYNFIFT